MAVYPRWTPWYKTPLGIRIHTNMERGLVWSLDCHVPGHFFEIRHGSREVLAWRVEKHTYLTFHAAAPLTGPLNLHGNEPTFTPS